MMYFRFVTSKPFISCQHESETTSGFTFSLTFWVRFWVGSGTRVRVRFCILTALAFFLSACASTSPSPSDQQRIVEATVATPLAPQPPETPGDGASTSETPDTVDPAVTHLESGLTRFGTIQPAGVTEASGMAFSGRQSNLLWLINDSGNDAILHNPRQHDCFL